MTLLESAPPRRGAATLSLRPSWTLDDYRALLTKVADEWGPFIGLEAYAQGTPGVWLRHDVELSLYAAELMATAEHELGVRATYFLCPRSPLLEARPRRLSQAAERLGRRGHDVGVHLLDEPLPHALPAWATTAHVSFHAPTRPGTSPAASTRTILHDFASTASGEAVYRPVAQNLSRYASDSTGRWRSPDPWRRAADEPAEQLQLLIHPFWWAAHHVRDLPLSAAAETFLPKAAAQRRRQHFSEGWQTSELPVTRHDD